MKNLFLALLGIFLLGTATVGAEEKTPSEQSKREGEAPTALPVEGATQAPIIATKTVHMKIEGMTCAMCSVTITKKLTPLCQAVSIDHKTGAGQCTYEPGKTNQETIVKAVTDAGYKVVEAR